MADGDEATDRAEERLCNLISLVRLLASLNIDLDNNVNSTSNDFFYSRSFA